MFSRVIIVLALAVCASAFSGFRANSRSSAVTMMAGKSQSLPFLPQPPNLEGYAGNVGFDPAGFSNLIDIRWLREAELKHARVAMLAVVGWVVSEFVQLPGDIHQVGPVAAHDAAVKWGALAQVNIVVHFAELLSVKSIVDMFEGSGRKPGDFGFDPLNFSKDPKTAEKLALNELANGRLAMLAFSGIVTQAVLTGKGFPYF